MPENEDRTGGTIAADPVRLIYLSVVTCCSACSHVMLEACRGGRGGRGASPAMALATACRAKFMARVVGEPPRGWLPKFTFLPVPCNMQLSCLLTASPTVGRLGSSREVNTPHPRGNAHGRVGMFGDVFPPVKFFLNPLAQFENRFGELPAPWRRCPAGSPGRCASWNRPG